MQGVNNAMIIGNCVNDPEIKQIQKKDGSSLSVANFSVATNKEYKGKKTNFVSINNVKFRRKIVPGEKLDIDTNLDSLKRGIAKGSAESFVDGEPACSGEFIVTIPDVLDSFRPQQK